LLAFVAAAALMAPPASAASPPCQTKNVRTGVEYTGASALATAITTATAGDTITVWGSCVGNFALDRDLTLQGKGGGATLDGNQTGRVLNITTGTTATMRALTITNGLRSGLGGGIYVRPDATAVLVDSAVTGNTGGAKSIGGGIEADEGSSLTLIRSMVSGNRAGSSGGIDIFKATVSLIDSRVTSNHAARTPGPVEPGADGCGFGDPAVVYACAGGIWNYHGRLSLTNTTVSSNTAAYRAGGLRTDSTLEGASPIDGPTLLGGSTTITSNTADNQGGGIWARASQDDSSDPSVAFRAADGTASSIDPITGATLPAWTGSLFGNAPDQCWPTLTLGAPTCGSTFN